PPRPPGAGARPPRPPPPPRAAPARARAGPGRGCVPRVMARFVSDADPESLAADCVADLAPAPFFLDFTGPSP
ncbi:MAG: hypothetical protein JJT93_15195, partial [Gammaproteobacteria bacterium]|nr:hypothetical protein [Gammaproteobacteria bacterium]